MTLHNYTIPQLRKFVRFYNLHTAIKGYSKMTKDELVKNIQSHLSKLTNPYETKSHTLNIDTMLSDQASEAKKKRDATKQKKIRDAKDAEYYAAKAKGKELLEKVRTWKRTNENEKMAKEDTFDPLNISLEKEKNVVMKNRNMEDMSEDSLADFNSIQFLKDAVHLENAYLIDGKNDDRYIDFSDDINIGDLKAKIIKSKMPLDNIKRGYRIMESLATGKYTREPYETEVKDRIRYSKGRVVDRRRNEKLEDEKQARIKSNLEAHKRTVADRYQKDNKDSDVLVKWKNDLQILYNFSAELWKMKKLIERGEKQLQPTYWKERKLLEKLDDEFKKVYGQSFQSIPTPPKIQAIYDKLDKK